MVFILLLLGRDITRYLIKLLLLRLYIDHIRVGVDCHLKIGVPERLILLLYQQFLVNEFKT